MKTYVITISAMGAVTVGIFDAQYIEEVFEYLSGEYPNYTVHSVIEVPSRRLWKEAKY